MMNKENIGIRLEEVTMRMMYEFGSFKKQLTVIKNFIVIYEIYQKLL